MKVILAFSQHGDEILGIFSNRIRAREVVERLCPYPHSHNDQNRCGTTSFTLDEEIPPYVDPLSKTE